MSDAAKAKVKKRIFIVDDHAIVREGLKRLINQEPNLEVCGEAENAYDAFETIEKGQFDLAIIDISLEGMSGLVLAERIKSEFSNLPILILSMHDKLLYGQRALRVGAAGYVAKYEAAEKIVHEVNRILSN